MSSTMAGISNWNPAISAGCVIASRRPSLPGGPRKKRPLVSSLTNAGSSAMRSRKSLRIDSTTRKGLVASSATADRHAVNAARSAGSATWV